MGTTTKPLLVAVCAGLLTEDTPALVAAAEVGALTAGALEKAGADAPEDAEGLGFALEVVGAAWEEAALVLVASGGATMGITCSPVEVVWGALVDEASAEAGAVTAMGPREDAEAAKVAGPEDVAASDLVVGTAEEDKDERVTVDDALVDEETAVAETDGEDDDEETAVEETDDEDDDNELALVVAAEEDEATVGAENEDEDEDNALAVVFGAADVVGSADVATAREEDEEMAEGTAAELSAEVVEGVEMLADEGEGEGEGEDVTDEEAAGLACAVDGPASKSEGSVRDLPRGSRGEIRSSVRLAIS
ncbi:hypothetical protein C8Q78DRAFT_1076935 [Trametes maxima]|nr:hypothetical protein C8Q78DRAFT_1076935 [Trametes maxima]